MADNQVDDDTNPMAMLMLMKKLMMEIAVHKEALQLLNASEFSDQSVFRNKILQDYTALQISQSQTLQFGLKSTKYWHQHIQRLIADAQNPNRTSEQWKQLIHEGLAPFILSAIPISDVPQILIGCYIKQFINKNFCYGMVDANAITQITKFIAGQSCLEVGAGNGLWSRLLACEGVPITATDAFDVHMMCHGKDQQGIFYPVVKANVERAVEQFPADCLLLVWPKDYDFPEHFTGSKVIYVGEPEGGCTSAHPPPQHWKLADTVKVPQFPFAMDMCYLYQRK